LGVIVQSIDTDLPVNTALPHRRQILYRPRSSVHEV